MPKSLSPVTNTKILSLVSLLSNYDLFHISVDNGREFNATEIVGRNDGTIEFRRIFATSTYTDDIVVDIQAKSEKEFVCMTDKSVYVITALHTKPQDDIISSPKLICDVTDLMDVAFIGSQFTRYIKELDILLLVVDPYRLGNLSAVDQNKIQRIINRSLDGLSRSMQMCRTVCFQVRMNDGCKRIYAGVYDLEHQCSVTSKELYNERDREIVSNDFYSKVQAMRSYAEKEMVKILAEK